MSENPKRTVVVTGGSRGIGRAVCLAFAGPDTQIFFNCRAAADAARKTEALVAEAGGTATGVVADVTSEAAVAELFKTAMDATGRVDVLVNNAGITKDGLLVRMKESAWDAVMDVNLKGTFNCMKAAAKIMMKQRQGRIINVASLVGVTGNAGQANYVASKAGVIGLTKTVARELASRNVTANAVAPGYIETEMTEVLPEKTREEMLAQIPLGRAGSAEEVASVVQFLASEQAAYITGQVIHVSGGMYI